MMTCLVDLLKPQYNKKAGISIRPLCHTLVRVIYVPQAEPIVVGDLGLHAAFSARYFDPVSSALTKLGAVQADAVGS